MKDIGIMMRDPLVVAIRREQDPKTVTRRGKGLKGINENPDDWSIASTMHDQAPDGQMSYTVMFFNKKTEDMQAITSPYGYTGDRLWVKETWQEYAPYGGGPTGDIIYRADMDEVGQCPLQTHKGIIKVTPRQWKSSMLMPKRFCRIWLERTDMRPPERLQDITEAGARAEGVERNADGSWRDYLEPDRLWQDDAVASFISLYQSIHGPEEWERNPWVWPVDFKRIDSVSTTT